MNTCVLLLSFNHQQITAKALRSILKIFSDEKIILIHNGSDLAIVTELKREFPKITHLEIPTNLGYSGGMNVGFKYILENVHFSWCLALTNDTELISFNIAVENLPPSLVAPLIYFKSLKKIDSYGATYNSCRGKLHHEKNLEESWDINRYIPGTAMFFHRDIFKAKIFLDIKLFTFWEDVWWSRELEQNGVELRRSQDIVIAHSGGKSTRKDPRYTSYYFQRNRLIVSKKLCKRRIVQFFSVLYISSSIVWKIWQNILSGNFAKSKILSKAIRDAWKY